MAREYSREALVERIRDAVEETGWRIREGDRWQIVIMAPLARSNPDRNRWPHEPEEGPEDHGA